MLDQLLLRAEDAPLWAQSAHSLQYLVLDEFHTYDGAQGTDVAMLLRRLGLALKSHWADDDPSLTAEDRARPLGRITPVATSATLGDKGDPEAMLDFAETVFGEAFPPDSVITETRLEPDEWIGDDAADHRGRLRAGAVTVDAESSRARPRPSAAWTSDMHGRRDRASSSSRASSRASDATTRPIADTRRRRAARPAQGAPAHASAARSHARGRVGVRSRAALGGDDPLRPARMTPDERRWQRFVVALLAAFSHVRAVVGRDAASVDLHLWVRELTRIDRAAASRPALPAGATTAIALGRPRGGDGREQSGRRCPPSTAGTAGGPAGASSSRRPGPTWTPTTTTIRRRRMPRDDRFRPLIHAPAEGDAASPPTASQPVEGLIWFAVRERRLLATLPSDDARLRDGGCSRCSPTRGRRRRASLDDTCPACQQKDGIRFLGSAIATLLSVTLSTLFGEDELDPPRRRRLSSPTACRTPHTEPGSCRAGPTA